MGLTFITPVPITLTGVWADKDVSAYVPAGATMVLFRVYVPSTSGTFGIRKNGSTDDRYQGIVATAQAWGAIGVDENRIFEARGSAHTLEIIGYIDGDGAAFTNAPDKSLANASSWRDIDISVDTGDDKAVLAFIEIKGHTSNEYQVGFRKKGSTNATTARLLYNNYAAIGCDKNEVCQGYVANTAVDFFLIGYMKAGVETFEQQRDRSLGSTGAWYDLAALPDWAAAALYLVVHDGDYDYTFNLRKSGSADSVYLGGSSRIAWAIIECDASKLIEGKISNTNIDFYELAYFGTPPAPHRERVIQPWRPVNTRRLGI